MSLISLLSTLLILTYLVRSVSKRKMLRYIQGIFESLKQIILFHHWQVAHSPRDDQMGERKASIITGGVVGEKGGNISVISGFFFIMNFQDFSIIS